jgi:hypothetical protein
MYEGGRKGEGTVCTGSTRSRVQIRYRTARHQPASGSTPRHSVAGQGGVERIGPGETQFVNYR